MRINTKLLLPANLSGIFLLFLPLFRLDLINENYSTLTLKAEGHFYLHLLSIFLGLLLGYENLLLKNKRRALLSFLALYLGCLIPHHVPYDLQGDLHLLLAYSGGFVLIAVTYLDLFELGSLRLQSLFVALLVLALAIYIRFMKINVLSEFIIMTDCLICSFLLCKRKGV